MKKELKSGILSADKSVDCRPTVGGVNVIAVLARLDPPDSLKRKRCWYSNETFYNEYQQFMLV